MGLVVAMSGFLLLVGLPFNFSYLPFMLILILMGLGMGLFASPNMSAIMNSVPREYRGVASGHAGHDTERGEPRQHVPFLQCRHRRPGP